MKDEINYESGEDWSDFKIYKYGNDYKIFKDGILYFINRNCEHSIEDVEYYHKVKFNLSDNERKLINVLEFWCDNE